MGRVIEDQLMEPMVGLLLGAIDVGDRGTTEQRAVLHAIAAGGSGRPDLHPDAVAPLEPDAAADAITEPAARRRARELMVLLELCRHPLTEAQVDRVELYAAALGAGDGPGLESTRDLMRDGRAAAAADLRRFIDEVTPDVEELTLRGYGAEGRTPAADAALGRRLRALQELPEETLGHHYVQFYERNGIGLPGEEPHTPSVFVAHDMCHVLAGYEPTGQGEIALGALQLAMTDSDAHWIQFLANLAVHEAGYLGRTGLAPKDATLTRPGAVELLAHAFDRGERCREDFTTADHLALVELPIDEVRARFGIPPLDPADRQR